MHPRPHSVIDIAQALSGVRQPTDDDGPLNVDVQDMDYLAFGYWNKVAAMSSISDFVPFAYGSMPYDGNVSMLTGGKAIYMGKAAGGYEQPRLRLSAMTGKPIDSAYGHFTANVRLDAHFGEEGGRSTIDGVVDGFLTRLGRRKSPLSGGRFVGLESSRGDRPELRRDHHGWRLDRTLLRAVSHGRASHGSRWRIRRYARQRQADGSLRRDPQP